jgi:hypothetical protein
MALWLDISYLHINNKLCTLCLVFTKSSLLTKLNTLGVILGTRYDLGAFIQSSTFFYLAIPLAGFLSNLYLVLCILTGLLFTCLWLAFQSSLLFQLIFERNVRLKFYAMRFLAFPYLGRRGHVCKEKYNSEKRYLL